MKTLLCFLLLATAALAQSVDGFRPDCGAEGDLVMISGEGFSDDPAVDFDGTEADVIRSTATRILVRVPEGATTGLVTVDRAVSQDDFTVLAAGSPVVYHASASKATAGQRIFVVGRRLSGSSVEFIDGEGNIVDTVKLQGRHRAAFFKVPEDIAADTYMLNFVNGDGLESGDCSPTLEIVEAGEAAIDSIDPEGALPGERVTIHGSDLGRLGPVHVTWTDGDGKKTPSFGFSNGYDKIFTNVPFKAEAGATYDVSIKQGNVEAGSIEYTVGERGAPVIDEIDPSTAPAGSFIRIKGSGLLFFGSMPTVAMTMGDTTVEAKVVGGHPHFGKHAAALIVRVPEDAADGDYDVTVTVGDQTSNAETFTVGQPALAVTSMSPTSQGERGTFRPVRIEGSGFGFFGSGRIAVTWDNGVDDPREGFIVFRTDRRLDVIPPGGRFDPLAKGTYEVTVVRGDESASAGEYTVE